MTRAVPRLSARAVLAGLVCLLPAATCDAAAGRASRPLTAEQMRRLWRQVGGEDLRQVRSAVDALAGGGDEVVAFVRRQIAPALAANGDRGLAALIARLDDDRYAVRESSSRQIRMLGRRAGPALRRALRSARSEEVRVRVGRLIEACSEATGDTVEGRQLVRAACILERIGTERAGALLRDVQSSPSRPHLERRRTGKHVVEAGFVPDKDEYVWGEPIQNLAFVVRNVGEEALTFDEGGDYRGSGRHERFKISAVDANGRAVTDPLAGRPNMGGMGTRVTLEPGRRHVQLIAMHKRLRFAGPGVYTVTCKRTLNCDTGGEKAAPGVAVATTFRLTIRPYSPQRMRLVIEDLADRIRAGAGVTPRCPQTVLGRSTEIDKAARLHFAMSALAEINDGAAVAHLTRWLESRDPNIRSWGLRGLSKFSTGQVEGLLIGALRKDEVGHVRSEAARCLAAFRSPAAQAALIAALDDAEGGTRGRAATSLGSAGLADPNTAVTALGRALRDGDSAVRTAASGALGRRLGKALPKKAANLLLPMMDDSTAAVRREAGIALALLGDKRAVAKIKQHIADDRTVLAQMLMKLGEPFDCAWITPIIRSRKGNEWQNAIHFVRKHGGKEAAAALIGCLDFDKPTANYYNYTLCWQIAAAGGPRVTYHHDFDSDGTAAQQAHNAEAMKKLKAWADEFERKRKQD